MKGQVFHEAYVFIQGQDPCSRVHLLGLLKIFNSFKDFQGVSTYKIVVKRFSYRALYGANFLINSAVGYAVGFPGNLIALRPA